jgi:hypothetical protein
MQSPSERHHALVAGLLNACAGELALLRARVAEMEAVVAPVVMQSPAIVQDGALQAALQEFDWISQHLHALHSLLASVSEQSSERGGEAIVAAVGRVGLKEVAERVAAGLGGVPGSGDATLMAGAA